MPLRDHFSATIPRQFRWEGFHSAWPVTIMGHLNRSVLPPGYQAEPRVRLGGLAEIDVGTREAHAEALRTRPNGSNVGLVVYSPPVPGLSLETDLSRFAE
jgi:hypothetical protein